jgi:hypothetical protein
MAIHLTLGGPDLIVLALIIAVLSAPCVIAVANRNPPATAQKQTTAVAALPAAERLPYNSLLRQL